MTTTLLEVTSQLHGFLPVLPHRAKMLSCLALYQWTQQHIGLGFQEHPAAAGSLPTLLDESHKGAT